MRGFSQGLGFLTPVKASPQGEGAKTVGRRKHEEVGSMGEANRKGRSLARGRVRTRCPRVVPAACG